MYELKELLRFMRSSCRKKITLNDYERLTNKKFSFAKKAKLINYIQKSQILSYQKVEREFYVVLNN
jgi:hypothetical protein